MLTRQLPQDVNLKKLADHDAELEGVVSLSRLTRFGESLLSDQGEVCVSLKFFRNEKGQKEIHGRLSVTVSLCCQRCLEPVEHHVSTELALGVIAGQALEPNLDESLEPFITEEETVPLVDLIEDDLLLNLPMVAYHEIAECRANGYVEIAEKPEAPEPESKQNPFAVLEQLKRQR